MHLQGAAHPAARTPRSGTVTGVVSNRPAGASNQFHAISTPHARQSHGGNSPQGSDPAVAHAVPADPPACHRDRKARKDAPKRGIWDIARARGMRAKRRRP